MGLSSFGVRGESTYFGPLAITIRLRRRGEKTPLGWAFRSDLGQRRELVIGAIPLDFLMYLIAGGRSADA